MIERVTVPSLSHDEQNTLDELVEQLKAKTPRNLLRSAYYDGKNAVPSGIVMPPYMQRIKYVLGWAAKAVDILNRRCKLQGYVIPGATTGDDMGLSQVWDDNRLDIEAPMAGVSSLIHAAAFLVTTQGDTQSGEPAVLVAAKDALSGTGLWDARKRSLKAFLSVIEADNDGQPVDMAMYLPDLNVSMTKTGAKWTVTRRAHSYGLPVEPLVYQPRLGRPFGSSRISRPVMSLHDGAIRTVIRSEISAERYSVAQRVLLGADESAFRNADGTVKPVWQAILDNVWAIPDDEDATNPRADVKEFSAGSQEPHMAQLRAQAQLFAGETSIPISSLGISTDANPASEGAYSASREDLWSEAEGTIDGWSPAWRRTGLNALRMLHGWDTAPAELQGLQPKWRDVRTSSRAAAADAAIKLVSQNILPADSDVTLEMLGFDDLTIKRVQADRRRAGGSAALQAIRDAAALRRTVVTGAGLNGAG